MSNNNKKIGQKIYPGVNLKENLLSNTNVSSLAITAPPGTKFGINYTVLKEEDGKIICDSQITIGILGVFQISDIPISNLAILSFPPAENTAGHYAVIDYVYEEVEGNV